MNLIDLTGGKLECLSADPDASESWKGRIYFNTGSGMVRIHNGSAWKIMNVGDFAIDISTPPTNNQVLQYNEATQLWEPVSLPLAIETTDDVPEGVTNLYYTDGRVASAPAVTALDTRLDTAEADITALEAADVTLQTNINNEATARAAADTALDTRLDTAEANIISLDTRLDTAESEIDALQAADTSLDGRLDTAESEIDALQTDQSTHEAATSAHGVTGDLVGTQGAQDLEEKTLVSPSITGSVDVADVAVEPLAPSAGVIRLFNDSDTLKVKKSDGSVSEVGSGSGSGEKNYISSAFADWGISGGGTFAINGSSNLPREHTTGTGFVFTSSTDGEYVYTRFTLDEADKYKKLKAFLSANVADTSRFKVEIHKNSASDYSGSYTEFNLDTDESNDSYLPDAIDDYLTYFTSDGDTYLEFRIVHEGVASDSIYFSDILLGPGVREKGAVADGWEDATAPASGWIASGPTNVSTTVRQRQVGDSIDLEYLIVYSSASAAFADVQLRLPSGLTIDTSKIEATAAQRSILPSGGYVRGTTQASDAAPVLALANSTTDFVVRMTTVDSATEYVSTNGGSGFGAASSISNTTPGTWQSGSRIHVYLRGIPITEWRNKGTTHYISDSVIHANARCAYGGITAATALNTSTVIKFKTQKYDTSNSYSTSTGRFTAPANGYYHVDARIWCSGIATDTQYVALDIFKNGTIQVQGLTYGAQVGSVSGDIYLAKGDYIDIRGDTTAGVTANDDAAACYLSIHRLADYSAGTPVGTPLATSSKSGLVKGGVVPGSDGSSATATGYIGETVTATMTDPGSVSVASSSDNAVTGTLSIPSGGVWLIHFGANLRQEGRHNHASDGQRGATVTVELYDGSSDVAAISQTTIVPKSSSADAIGGGGAYSEKTYVYRGSTSKSFSLRWTGSIDSNVTLAFRSITNCVLYATRIG